MTTAMVARAPAALARATIAHHSKSFALASRLLPPRIRDQTAVVYTWCRRADDAIDEQGGGEGTLARLEGELAAAYADRGADPVLAAFGQVARERAIPIAYPRALLAGMAMDLGPCHYATVEDVLAYAWHVAGVVGLMMTHVFGVADDAALVPAAHLGIAMQLTNICRDVREDWALGRLYLPADALARHGVPGLAGALGAPLPAAAHPAIAATTRDLLALADRYYRSGDRGVAALPWRAALAVRAARRVYRAIGPRVSLARRAVVPVAHKLALVAGALGRSVVAVRPRQRYHVPRLTLELADVPRC